MLPFVIFRHLDTQKTEESEGRKCEKSDGFEVSKYNQSQYNKTRGEWQIDV